MLSIPSIQPNCYKREREREREMADDFQAGICSGSWWIESSARSTGFDAHAMSTSAVEAADISGSFVVDEPSASASSSSITFQDNLMFSPSQIPGFGLSLSTMDWAQALLKTSGRVHESGLQPYFHHGEPPSIDADRVQMGVIDSSMMNPFKGTGQSFLSDHDDSGGVNTFQISPGAGSYGDFYEPENRSSSYDSSLMGYYGSLSSELPKFPSKQPQSAINPLQFSNDTVFWNAPASQFTDQKPNSGTVNTTVNTEGARCSSSSTTKKSGSGGGGEHALKKPRIETPSPLPTFKVRKEKLGDRITALQQLVSPFGKTDTASVLHEAILYIKFLHEQVVVLSTPYMKNGHPMQQKKPESSKGGEAVNQDLRSRGLCLVPVASTYTVASENPMDFWTPTFGGTFR